LYKGTEVKGKDAAQSSYWCIRDVFRGQSYFSTLMLMVPKLKILRWCIIQTYNTKTIHM
jgi:hypothetical protein